MFSVLMSVYINDDQVHFREALDSIFTQTFMPKQFVLVCDGTVYCWDVIYEYMEKFESANVEFTLINLEKNQGLGLALRAGVRKCNQNYIIRMDSDDISNPNRFELTKLLIENNPDASVFGGQIEEFNKNPGDLNRFRKVPCDNGKIIKYAKKRNPMNHVSVAVERKSLLEVGNYESIMYHEDYFLWIKFILSTKKLINSPDTFVMVRVGNDLVGRRKGLKYIAYEMDFTRACMKAGFFNQLDTFFYLAPRFLIRLLPASILKLIYQVLRK
jgi:glycosyltransferase involved in cell wall biosynthesis